MPRHRLTPSYKMCYEEERKTRAPANTELRYAHQIKQMRCEEPERMARRFFHLRSVGKLQVVGVSGGHLAADKSSPDILPANLHCLVKHPL